MHQKRTKKNPFDYMKNGSLHKKSNFLFLSERHISRKERNLYFLPCQMHQEKDKQIVPFDYMTLKKNVICTFCFAKCIRKGQNNCSFWLALFTKRAIFGSFLNVIFLEKNVICNFCLAKCIRKGQKICFCWLHEEWLSPQKEQFFVLFWTSSF